MAVGKSTKLQVAVLVQAQHADLGKERERLQVVLTDRQLASIAAEALAPDASVDALLNAVRAPKVLCMLGQTSHMLIVSS